PQIAGRAAAEVHRVHQMVGGEGGGLRQMGAEGVGIRIHPVLGPGQGVEVAVDALAPAEGDVEIQAQRGRSGLHENSSKHTGHWTPVYSLPPRVARARTFSWSGDPMESSLKGRIVMDMTPQEYQQYVKRKAKKSPLLKNTALAFGVGGAICAAGQLILNG